MAQSLQEHIVIEIKHYTDRHPAAWLVWCDPHGDWAPLLTTALRNTGIPLVEVTEHTAGQLGGPVSRGEVQARIAEGKPFVLRVVAEREQLGWLWGQALRAEHIYSRSLREQLGVWGWRPQVLHISDEELRVLAEQNLQLDPANWGGGGLEPNLDLLLNHLLFAGDLDGAQRVLLNLSAERAGLPQPDLANMSAWRARAIARLLVSDAQRHAPALVTSGHEHLIPPPARALALNLVDRWLDSRVYSAELPRAIDEAEAVAALDTLLAGAGPEYGPFLSRRAEHVTFTTTCQRLGQLDGRDLLEALAAQHDALAAHATCFWAREGKDGAGDARVPWVDLARLSDACRDLVAASPTQPWRSPQEALDWYTGGGWQVDRAGEALLRNLFSPDPALVALLTPLRTAYRARWEQQLMWWSDVWQAAGAPTPAFPTAGDRLISILKASRPTAIIVIDALRYDLGHALAQMINAQESAQRAEVQTARAPLPSVTALGMGMALPIHEAELVAECTNGRWALRERGQERNLSIAAKRREWWVKHGHVAEDALFTVQDALNRPVPSPANWRPRLVVYDDAIDDQGHDGELEAAGTHDLLRRYVQVVQRLRDANWKRIAIVTDHGYIHWVGQHDQRIAPPAGDVVYTSRRAVAYRPDMSVSGAQALAPGTHYPVAVPSGVACFAAYGKRGYFHGGASLQEWIIPVVLVDWPTRARPVELSLRGQTNILSQRQRIIVQVAPVMFVDELLAREVVAVILHGETRAELFTSAPTTIYPTDTEAELVANVRPGAIAGRGTAVIIEIRDTGNGAVLASASSRLMIALKQTDDADSW